MDGSRSTARAKPIGGRSNCQIKQNRAIWKNQHQVLQNDRRHREPDIAIHAHTRRQHPRGAAALLTPPHPGSRTRRPCGAALLIEPAILQTPPSFAGKGRATNEGPSGTQCVRSRGPTAEAAAGRRSRPSVPTQEQGEPRRPRGCSQGASQLRDRAYSALAKMCLRHCIAGVIIASSASGYVLRGHACTCYYRNAPFLSSSMAKHIADS
jgi:hypothetical protein